MTRRVSNETARRRGRADALAGREPDGGVESPDGFSYDRGYQAGLEQRSPTKKPAKKTPKAKKKPAARKRSSPKRSTGRRRRRGAPLSAAARRQIEAPIRAQFTSGMTLIGIAFGVAVLYNFLRHADTTATAIDKLTGMLRWLDSPQPIPYRIN